MSARRGPAEEEEEELDGGPGLAYMPFVVMDDLLDKLKLLGYDKDFLVELKMKPLSRHYFALQTNPGEQFYLFTSLSAWLIRKTGRNMEQPQEYDDPNSTVSNILDHLRQLGIAVDFPPNKLKVGYGEHAIFVLDRLADFALKQDNFLWKKPIYPAEDTGGEDGEVKDEAELTLDKVEEEMMAEYDDDDEEENILHMDDLKDLTAQKDGDAWPDEILHSNTTSEEWRLELERVLPQLKVTIRSDTRDWRSHIEQMHEHRSKINETLNFTQKQLDGLHSEISRSLEKISSREKYLNGQLEPLLLEYRNLQNVAAESREQYRVVSTKLVEKSHELAQISDELDRVKHEMEERGSSMTDGIPIPSCHLLWSLDTTLCTFVVDFSPTNAVCR
ncbi:intraflagellar transport protein 57 homolog isoform X2 [Homarus americanus]|uniref:intraflagellar transport protein 57 homolog isoform X2 n=1 Tax=Homarus americanus TaxID=6706 RepID=UPI001C43E548|nr:intraflagellar transport protein 57 homolog isoform X2 [Homarus americanus]